MEKIKSICCLVGSIGIAIVFLGFFLGLYFRGNDSVAIITGVCTVGGSILFLGGITEFKWAYFETK